MAGKWTEDDGDSSTPPSSPAPALISRRKFEDEEKDDSDILESWDAAEDSEVEREKARVAAERKAKADAETAASKRSKAQRVAEKKADRARKLAEEIEEFSEEDDTTKRKRLQNFQHESDLAHAEDLFGNMAFNNTRKTTTAANAVQIEANGSNAFLDLTTLPLFNPDTKLQFEKMRDTLLPVISKNSNKAHYTLFLQEFTKQLARELPSEQIKKIASTLTALSNEKMKEEKLAEKGGKKSKAAKTKATLVASRNISATPDVNAYDDEFGDDDFM